MADSQSMASTIPISSTTDALIDPPADPITPSATPQELAKSDLWIFRDGRREISGRKFLCDLQEQLGATNALLDSVIQAGELEAALADVNAPDTSIASALTDALARQLYAGNSKADPQAEQLARQINPPATLSVAPPEGFTYYALHPMDFARAAEPVSHQAERFAVIGIRSIGTTLSALVTAALNAVRKPAVRITVRPSGHPYSRQMQFSSEQQRWITDQFSKSGSFLVVDEGPGRSGSTFLSVAEALSGLGVSSQRITLIGSRAFDPNSLCAPDAAERWRQFHFIATTPAFNDQFANWLYLGGGEWRKYFCGEEQNWPESWTQMERFKVLSPDDRRFVKFEGMGRIGKEVRARAFALGEAGFSPAAFDIGGGFLSYASVQGKHLRNEDLSADVLEQAARYCAFRASEFRQDPHGNSELEQMLVHNVQEEFGRQLQLAPGCLSPDKPVLVDGRMQAHEWIAGDGKLVKTDAISHGDNHFFPGPCGITWDLAGAIVEWDLDLSATEFLLRKFRGFSGIDVTQDLTSYLLAYCVFRLGFCKMARSTVLGSREENRLNSAYCYYRSKARRLLETLALD